MRAAAALAALALLAGPALASGQGEAAPSAPRVEIKPLDPSLFPVPDSLLSNVNFWTDIFARYSSHQVVLHDELVPQRIYRLLDFTSLDNAITSDVLKKRRREAVVKQGLAEVGGLLRKLAAGDAAALESEEGQRVTALFGGSPTRGELLAAAQNLRAQPGLSDIFAGAITRAGRYLPHLEEIFRGYGLPVELTRLPFIESMFQLNARSKVSAGGMWQIMPATGRRFLRVGREVDERFDPLSAGTAAAQILTENYQMLGSWPLALTAYNHGPYGVARAVSQLGTRDIGTICAAWKGKAFGFASRNFYAEFVAAATLFENREHFFPGVALAPPLAFDEFVPDRYVHARDLAREAKANVTDLADLNPAVADEIWAGRLFLPAGYRLRVPAGSAESFQVAYAALPPERKIARQPVYQHRVRRGETLASIARQYGLETADLAQLNHLGRKSRLRAGQVLRLPPPVVRPPAAILVAQAAPTGPQPAVPAQPAGASTTVPAPTGEAAPTPANPGVVPAEPLAAQSAPATAAQALPEFHVVAAGETLFGIARRYGVSVQALQRANGLGRKGVIYPGQKLKLER